MEKSQEGPIRHTRSKPALGVGSGWGWARQDGGKGRTDSLARFGGAEDEELEQKRRVSPKLLGKENFGEVACLKQLS